ncbi:LexA family protein [Anaerococcus vaginimassiliensis]|uniref:LexA family protein n=1 Tax=Anaerococcus vaginimassiliensis TaxID=2042308 RepID=UPI001031A75E|nr:XRE family transcriptional regulator [Anaerococcus vaginimassiliensis]
MEIKDKLRQLRKDNGYNQEDVAFKLDMSTSAYGYYEQGKTTPPLNKLKRLAEIYKISISELTGEPKDKIEVVGRSQNMHTYPYFDSYAAAGNPITIDGINNAPRIHVADELLGQYAGNEKLVFLKVSGESMNKIIPDGSTIGILEYDSVHDLKDGDIVVYATKDEEYAVKFFYRNGDKIIFKPFSTYSYYYDKIFDIDDNIKIIGKVVVYSVMI